MTEQNTLDDLKTPLFAALGAGDYAYEAVSEVVEKLRAAATDASKDFQTKVDEAQAKVEEARGSAQAKLTEAKDGLPKDVDELRAKFTADELRKVAAAYIQVATDIYESLAERGESAYDRIKSGSVIEDATEQATKAYNSAVELTESSLGQVATATKQVGERAAKLVGRAGDEVEAAADKAEAAVEETTAKAATAVKKAAPKAAAKKADA
ncbi:heparin-binding hemagglutinin [Tsukamurella ocularis]|uniref:heparin-binding hemagglutinin n=1 Tax=Tsukamurella ocularis TaxID=1970234 RepID=UPI0039EFA6FD